MASSASRASSYDHPVPVGQPHRAGPGAKGLIEPPTGTCATSRIRDIKPESIMPTYGHLFDQTIDFDAAESRVRAMAMLGVPYGDAVKKVRPPRWRTQARAVAPRPRISRPVPARTSTTKKIVALIAYIKRLGTDLSKPAPAPPRGDGVGSWAGPTGLKPGKPEPDDLVTLTEYRQTHRSNPCPELMSSFKLTTYPIVALVLFLAHSSRFAS